MTAFSMFNPSDPESAQNDEIVSEARSFFCDLYGRPDDASLDKLRAHLFASSRRDLRSLPPTDRRLIQVSCSEKSQSDKPVETSYTLQSNSSAT